MLGFPLRLFQLQMQQQQAEGASRQDAARLGAMNSKLTKDFNRVNAIALDLGSQVCVGSLPQVARLRFGRRVTGFMLSGSAL